MALTGFLKTTGGKGLHVVLPIRATLTWDEAKSFTKSVADFLVRTFPDRFTATASKERAQGQDLHRLLAQRRRRDRDRGLRRPGPRQRARLDADRVGRARPGRAQRLLQRAQRRASGSPGRRRIPGPTSSRYGSRSPPPCERSLRSVRSGSGGILLAMTSAIDRPVDAAAPALRAASARKRARRLRVPRSWRVDRQAWRRHPARHPCWSSRSAWSTTSP